MRFRSLLAASLALSMPAAAHAQAGHEQHHASPAGKPATRPAPEASATRPASAPFSPAKSGPDSVFATYRPFNPEEPMIDWRLANEVVREIGGHAGLTKSGGERSGPPGDHAGGAGHAVHKKGAK